MELVLTENLPEHQFPSCKWTCPREKLKLFEIWDGLLGIYIFIFTYETVTFQQAFNCSNSPMEMS